MMRAFALKVAAAATILAATPAVAQATALEEARWRAEAARAHIVRDDFGIAHVHGISDADAVFAMIYAEAEDDFNRVETNYLTALGRMSEAEGESAVYQDLRQRLWVDPARLKTLYAQSPPWLKRLMDAWADGLNFYLERHPETRPKVLKRFEPWMALSFTEGSIGGDIERAPVEGVKAFYGEGRSYAAAPSIEGDGEPRGSNGVAIAPSNTRTGRALLLINPHTSFFFRSELQVSSDEGLNAYGAATWGQFFVYQGFNPRLGFMHTSSGVDAVDAFAETIVRRGGRPFYRFGSELLPVTSRIVALKVRRPDGSFETRSFTTYTTRHGPVVRAEGGRWIAQALMDRPVEALSQSFLRTKARTFAEYMKVMALQANSSNNTIYADADGNIAYLHPQFIPRRDDRFDYTRPVDGSDPATAWRGVHALDEAPHLLNPPNGWIMNTNDWPYSAAGAFSPKASDFPKYMDVAGENPRGMHATRLLENRRDFDLEALRAAAFDSSLPEFDVLLPLLAADVASLDPSSALARDLQDPARRLMAWDRRWSAASTQTSLAVFWGEALWRAASGPAAREGRSAYAVMADPASRPLRLAALKSACEDLRGSFGGLEVPWGEINRFQRVNDDLAPHFSDKGPSIPVPFTSARWGSLASFGARPYPGTRRWYGTSGNSFVAVVEFGPRIRALAVTAGGESGHPGSPHFDDEAERYASGALRPIYFYPEDLEGHTERSYAPGAE